MIKPYARHKARKLALQAIYQWQMTSDDIAIIEAQFAPSINAKKIDKDYFFELVRGVAAKAAEIDECMLPFLDRKISALDVVELAVLRLAVYELLYKLDVPYKVVINEALKLAKIFGSVDGFKYINGILDKVAKKVRVVETGG